MTSVPNINHLSRRLEHALETQALPARLSGLGTHLLQQLKRPMQISVAGHPGNGKTSLVNMLLGWMAVPAVSSVPIIEISYGPEPRSIIDLANGESETLDFVPEAWHDDRDILRVRFELPEDGLASRSFAEVTFDPNGGQNQDLLAYLAQHSAITIWCSETFSEQEQTLWSSLPDTTKDHGFLALTMADRQVMKGTLAPRIAQLESYVSEEFYGLYPVATMQALQSRNATEGTAVAMWEQSGGASLLNAVEKQVTLGRSEDADRAQMLLEQSLPDAPVQTQKAVQPKAVATSAPMRVQTRKSPAELTRKDILQKGLGRMQSCAEQLLQDTQGIGGLQCTDILESCLASLRDVSDLLGQDGAANDPALCDFVDDIQDGENMLLLLQLEQDEAATADAVSLMLQLKKEIAIQAYA